MGKKLNKAILLAIILIGAYLRLDGLGYSHFYGDETKAIYYRKNMSAVEFFLNQRKGPGQFFLTWTLENIIGKYDEFLFRLPFALAGIVSIYLFYLIVKRLFGELPALFSASLFALNGFYLAFSRTVQYQSFYILFGLSAIYLFVKENRRQKDLTLAGLCLGLGFLFHYDTIFFLWPLIILILGEIKQKNLAWKNLFGFFLAMIMVSAPYYLFYVFKGSFFTDTLPYLLHRRSGDKALPSSTFYTFQIYHPLYVYFVVTALGLVSIWQRKIHYVQVLLLWFLFPFLLFQVIFKSAGTHMHNFILPWIVLCGVGFAYLEGKLPVRAKRFFEAIILLVLLLIFTIQAQVFVPRFNRGYPWKDSRLLGVNLPKLRQDLQIFVYGLPYYRAWDQVAQYLDYEDTGRFYYTNDNFTVSDFYMRKFKYYDGRATQNYVHILDNQLSKTEIDIRYLDTLAYLPVKEFTHRGEVVAVVYHRLNLNRH